MVENFKNRDLNVVVFKDGELQLDVSVCPEENTVWLNRMQISMLFDRDIKTIGRHINNIFKEKELDKEAVVAKYATTAADGKTYQVDNYNLDVIISVGYRVKSQRGIEFRKWANGILKDYMVQGYAVNEKRLQYLNKTIRLQSGIIAGIAGIDADSVLQVVEEYTAALELLDSYDHQSLKKPDGTKCVYQGIIAGIAGIDADSVLQVVEEYTAALELLDSYDHQSLKKPDGTKCVYQLTYEESREFIDKMSFDSDVFGVEKEPGKVAGILAAVYQDVFSQEVYPTLEEKAANLLYFLIKDHPFADGCKRIAAALFLEFLNKNNALLHNGEKIISDSALVAITLMVAESKPEEKEIMIALVMNFLIKN